MVKEINALGLICPMPLLKLKLMLAQCQSNDDVLIRVSDRSSIVDIPSWANKKGYQVKVELISTDETLISVTK